MIKAIGFNAGQIGDLVMNTVTCRAFKEKYWNSSLTFGIGNKYSFTEFLFKKNKYIDNTHIWDSYDWWPVRNDIDYVACGGFDIVFNAMPQHTRIDWYNHYHYCEEFCLTHQLNIPADLSCHLEHYQNINIDKKLISLSLFPSCNTMTGNKFEKTLNIEKLEELVKQLIKMGFTVIQLGGKFDQHINGALKYDNFSFKDGVDTLLKSLLHITTDTSFNWVGSAYKKNTIGLYGKTYSDMKEECIKNIQPINKNAIYLNGQNGNIKNIQIEDILDKVKLFN